MRLRVLCVLCGSILLSGCEQAPAEYRTQFLALGTLVEVQIAGAPRGRAEAAAAAVRAELQDFTARWRPAGDGELARINAALDAGRPAALTPEARALIDQARDFAERSGHRFNPAIFRLVRLWGFDDGEAEGPPPADGAIRALVEARPRMSDLAIVDGRLVSGNPAVQLDFGAHAKGVAVTKAIALLRARGIENAIVNAGGDLQAIGQYTAAAQARPWHIGIRHPRRPDAVLASLTLHSGEAVFTSGDYERYYQYAGRRYHHILDPATGRPARGVTSVTVVHRNAALADAASTALFVAGPEHWRETARSLGVEQVMLVTADGRIELTGAMRARVTLVDTGWPQEERSP